MAHGPALRRALRCAVEQSRRRARTPSGCHRVPWSGAGSASSDGRDGTNRATAPGTPCLNLVFAKLALVKVADSKSARPLKMADSKLAFLPKPADPKLAFLTNLTDRKLMSSVK